MCHLRFWDSRYCCPLVSATVLVVAHHKARRTWICQKLLLLCCMLYWKWNCNQARKPRYLTGACSTNSEIASNWTEQFNSISNYPIARLHHFLQCCYSLFQIARHHQEWKKKFMVQETRLRIATYIHSSSEKLYIYRGNFCSLLTSKLIAR